MADQAKCVLGDRITNVKVISEVENGPMHLENENGLWKWINKMENARNIREAIEVKVELTEITDEVSTLGPESDTAKLSAEQQPRQPR